MRTRLACLALLTAGLPTLPAALEAQQSPAGRARHHLVHDPVRGTMLLFGGAQSRANGAVRDTMLWSWDGSAWRALGGLPPARANAAAAFDAARQLLLVHGGSSLAVREELDDTWGWNGREWQLLANEGTGRRAHHAMTYDARTRHVVLFGNSDNAPDNVTWGWDGSRWTQLATEGPPRRGVHTMAYDSRRGVVVLFGGYGSNSTYLSDTWEWNGTSWRQVVTRAAPSPRYDTHMSFDPVRNRMVLFGGRGPDGNLADTWEYAGTDWVQVESAGPSARNGHAMAYDPRTRAVLLFGGRDEPQFHEDLWAFDGAWRRISPR